ncbi:PD-(D/E)XK motif protein [Daejeonella oryzae]|uniref:PD-(D/E)XK motif protein n=1 Tax=Daejeonella oryzae TaxID=1122943 RepID=UPI00041AFCC9|nr:PD-(D/E)XK motif protein [Daejeonella oryzae]
MKIEELELKWQLISTGQWTGIKSLRIDSESIPDLFIGLSAELKRGLILKLPGNYLPDFQSSVKQNLSLELFPDTRWVVLTLLDEQYIDLFDDLIFSIYNKISNISEASVYVSELLKTYHKWSEFFQENQGNGLTDDAVKGIFGELVVLNDILKSTGSGEINDVLNSWKGPYDTGQDFIGEHKNIEVKTKLNSAAHVRISSEFQLQPEPGKELDLLIVNINPDPLDGNSLKDLVLIIRDYVVSKLGDYTILLKSLSQKGLTIRNLENYDHLKFIALNMVTYSCTDDDFPRLIRTNLPDAINTVSYKLNLTAIQPYLIYDKTL